MRGGGPLVLLCVLSLALATPSLAKDEPAETDVSAPLATVNPEQSITLSVSIHADAAVATDARLVLVAENGTRTEVEGHVTTGSRVVIEPAVAVSTAVIVTCEGHGWWCPEVRLKGAKGTLSGRVRLPVFQSSRWHGRVETAGRDLPSTLLIQGWVRLTAEHDPLASFTTRVTIADANDAAGRWYLDVPDALLDLRISAKGFATVYRWGMRAVNEPKSTLHLVPGSSVAGFVVDAVDNLPAAGARVTAVQAGMAGDDPERRRAAPAHLSAIANDRGFFQVAGLAPGTYRLEAALPDRPLAFLEPVEVGEDAESILDDAFVLPTTVTLDVRVTPVATAEETPWLITLVPRIAPRYGPPVIEQRVDGDGNVRFEGLARQPHTLLVAGENDSLYEQRTLVIENDMALDITLPLVLVTGTVHLEDEPIEAGLRFETGSGEAVVIESNEDGAFRGWIRHPEHSFLFVSVSGREPRFERRLTIREPEIQNQTLDLDLNLSGANVAGDAVDRHGSPLHGVRIELFRGADRLARARTDGQGAFFLAAVEPGDYELMARHPEHGDAEPARLAIVHGRTPPDQRLTLVPRVNVEGQIRSSAGQPIATVAYELTTVGPFPTVSPRRQTDLNGRFRARIGAQASHVVVRVYAPGQVLWSGCLPVNPDRSLDIVLPPAPGGTLTVRLEGDPNEPPLIQGGMVLFGEHGGFFDWGDLMHWQTQSQARSTTDGPTTVVDVPRIAADRRYGVVWSTDPWPIVASQACGLRPVSDATWDHLPLGGSTILTLDTAALQADSRSREP